MNQKGRVAGEANHGSNRGKKPAEESGTHGFCLVLLGYLQRPLAFLYTSINICGSTDTCQ